MIGTTIGAYQILTKLGEGGMGTVYAAQHTLLGRQAAIKVLLPEMSVNQKIVNRFFNEARAVTSISDPGIVQVFDFGFHSDGSAFIVMELLIGESLEARLQRMKRLQAADAMRICRQVASSLASAHARGVIHRDLKPDNIFIVGDPAMTGGERTKILDFGIAKLSVDKGQNATSTDAILGTPVYMSPEQCRGAGEVDLRSDIYSLGCVLYRMLVGRPPFSGGGSGEVIACHLKETPKSAITLLPELDYEVDALVMRCLAKHPDDRPQTAIDLADLLGTLETGTTYKTPVPGISQPLIAAVLPTRITGRPQSVPGPPSTGFTAPDHTPIPDGHQRPLPSGLATEVMPGSATPTTMQSAAGETVNAAPAVGRRRGLVLGGIAAAGLALAVVVTIGVTGGRGETRANEPAPASQPVVAPPKPADPPPVEAKPVETKPVEAKPVETIEPRPAEAVAVQPPITKPKPKKKPIKPTGPTGPTGPATGAPPANTTPGPIDRGD